MRGLLQLVVLSRGQVETPLPLVVLQRGPINRHRRPLGRNVPDKLGNVAVLMPLPRDPCQFNHRKSLEVRHLTRLGQHVTTLAMPKTIPPQELSLVATFDPGSQAKADGKFPPSGAAQSPREQYNSGKETPLDKGQTVRSPHNPRYVFVLLV